MGRRLLGFDCHRVYDYLHTRTIHLYFIYIYTYTYNIHHIYIYIELSQNLVFSQDSVLASGYWTMWLSSRDQGLEVLGFQGPGLATCRHWSALQRRSQPLHFPKKDQQQGLIVPGQGQERQRGLISFRTLSITWDFDSLGASEICRHAPKKSVLGLLVAMPRPVCQPRKLWMMCVKPGSNWRIGLRKPTSGGMGSQQRGSSPWTMVVLFSKLSRSAGNMMLSWMIAPLFSRRLASWTAQLKQMRFSRSFARWRLPCD